MNAHEMCDADEACRLCCDLPAWISLRRPEEGQRRYRAKELDRSFNGLPTLVVEVLGAHSLIAAYKSNIVLVPGGERSWLVFSPLVVVWERSTEERGPGLGRPIVDHCVSSIAGFWEARARHIPNILVASGNLTVAKAGRPFFEALGWEIASPADFALHAGDAGLVNTLRFIAAQISAAISQFGQNAAETAGPLSFAMLRLTRAGIGVGLETPSQEHAARSGTPTAAL
jgi:hypothetical protein